MTSLLFILTGVAGGAAIGARLAAMRRQRVATRSAPAPLRLLRALAGARSELDRINRERPRWSYNTDGDRDAVVTRLRSLRGQLCHLSMLLDLCEGDRDVGSASAQPLVHALRNEQARSREWIDASDQLARCVGAHRRRGFDTRPGEVAEAAWDVLRAAEQSLEAIHRTHEDAIAAALFDVYRADALREWDRHLRDSSGHAYHGTSHLFLDAIREHGLSSIIVPADLRHAADDVGHILRRLGMNPTGDHTDVRPFDERQLSLTWREDFLNAACAPGLPAFAYELLNETYMGRRCPELGARVTRMEAATLRAAWELGAEFRSRSRIVRLRIRVDETFFAAMGRSGVLHDPETYLDAVLWPLITRDVTRAAALSMPRTLIECMIAFDPYRCTEIEARVRGAIPPEVIEVALDDGGWLSVRDWRDGAGIALVAPTPDPRSG